MSFEGIDIRQEAGGAVLTSGSFVTIAGPYRLLRYSKKTFTAQNIGTLTLSGCVLEVSSDPQGYELPQVLADPQGAAPQIGPSFWVTYPTANAFSNIAGGGVAFFEAPLQASHLWWRLRALSSQSVTLSASGYVTCQV